MVKKCNKRACNKIDKVKIVKSKANLQKRKFALKFVK